MGVGDWLSVVGLAIAIWQLWRMGRIAKATKAAVDDATQRIGVYNLLLIVPELSKLDFQIEEAAIQNRAEEMRRLLREWREAASSLRGVLAHEEVNSPTLDQLVRESISLAALAKTNLVTKGNVDLLVVTKKARSVIDQVCQETAMVAARIRSTATPLGVGQLDPDDTSGQ